VTVEQREVASGQEVAVANVLRRLAWRRLKADTGRVTQVGWVSFREILEKARQYHRKLSRRSVEGRLRGYVNDGLVEQCEPGGLLAGVWFRWSPTASGPTFGVLAERAHRAGLVIEDRCVEPPTFCTHGHELDRFSRLDGTKVCPVPGCGEVI
jgi:hypothetical protein